ncbi:hypothetical protein T03_16111 [Trichinella britovi]|uniref:Uncharacterized protein n=1 Tax=Trichinella britovi TaxID=45882 RepID=A0A0V1C5U0_TRIBR|nr:hypothetical protein T03_8431 [Trichinella britovi]KRY44592.1 hypothetical protein T03_14809 [Trichinella britovi]KRY44593.1 hypothetical protein T03_16111 [Trichinella britovi]
MNKDNIVDVLKTIEECNIGKNKGNRKCYKTGILSLKMNTKRKLIYLKSLEFLAKRQSCGWHFRYRHPDIAGNWLAHVFTGNTNPLKIKKEHNWTVPALNLILLVSFRHLVSCPKEEEEENLTKMSCMFSFISRRHCSSTESIQCKEKKQDGNALSRNFHPEQSTSQRPLKKKLAIDLQEDTTVKIRDSTLDYQETTPH